MISSFSNQAVSSEYWKCIFVSENLSLIFAMILVEWWKNETFKSLYGLMSGLYHLTICLRLMNNISLNNKKA